MSTETPPAPPAEAKPVLWTVTSTKGEDGAHVVVEVHDEFLVGLPEGLRRYACAKAMRKVADLIIEQAIAEGLDEDEE